MSLKLMLERLTMIPQIVEMSIPSYDFKKAPEPICKAKGGNKQQIVWADL